LGYEIVSWKGQQSAIHSLDTTSFKPGLALRSSVQHSIASLQSGVYWTGREIRNPRFNK